MSLLFCLLEPNRLNNKIGLHVICRLNNSHKQFQRLSRLILPTTWSPLSARNCSYTMLCKTTVYICIAHSIRFYSRILSVGDNSLLLALDLTISPPTCLLAEPIPSQQDLGDRCWYLYTFARYLPGRLHAWHVGSRLLWWEGSIHTASACV